MSNNTGAAGGHSCTIIDVEEMVRQEIALEKEHRGHTFGCGLCGETFAASLSYDVAEISEVIRYLQGGGCPYCGGHVRNVPTIQLDKSSRWSIIEHGFPLGDNKVVQCIRKPNGWRAKSLLTEEQVMAKAEKRFGQRIR
jgi:hypothetical protein